MLGVLCPQEGKRVRTEPIRGAGLKALCAYVCPGGRGEERRTDRAEKLLRRGGVRCLLPCRGYRPEVSLPEAEALPLYRALAHRLVLDGLGELGVPPQQAVVVLQGEYPDSDLVAAAYRLCPKVRQVVIDTQRSGVELQRRLYRDFGVSVGPIRAGERIFRACFSGSGIGANLRLCTQGDVANIRLDVPELQLPDFLERPPVLCALWQAGRLDPERVQVGGIKAGNKTT